jgi:phosphoglycerate dehydrogenase-like enzyme/pimeloyl-ACP methyl ester carboxylesterase
MNAITVINVVDDEKDLQPWIGHELRESGIEFIAKKCSSSEELIKYAASADVIWTRGRNDIITGDVLSHLPNCKAIMRSGSGMDGIPLEAAARLDIKTLNTPEAIAGSVAEHTVALLFALVRQIPQHDRDVRHGKWQSEPEWAKWHIPGQTIGLIGFGLIAQHVAKMLKGFDMQILAFDPYANQETLLAAGVTPVEFDDLISTSDFISVHCPLTDGTHHLIGENEFKAMKNNALLINTSRGAVIDEQALVRALQEKWIAGAAVDVTEIEPPSADSPLLKLDNLIITPHIAAFSDEFEYKFWKASVEKLKSFRDSLEAASAHKSSTETGHWQLPGVIKITYTSPADNTSQPMLFYAPDAPKDYKVPLLVYLHPWSADYLRDDGKVYAKWCVENGWALCIPNFRGRNNNPVACCSDLAVNDISGAVDYAKVQATIDTDKIYLVGVSGGGYASLLMAGRYPEIWAGVSSWVPIFDLKDWHADRKREKSGYFREIEMVCGGAPGDSPEIDEQYKQRSASTWLTEAKDVTIEISGGIHDDIIPISHTLRAFNVLAEPEDRIAQCDIEYIDKHHKLPAHMQMELDDCSYEKKILFRQKSNNARVTIFDGGHQILCKAALNFLSRQTKKSTN